MKHRICTIFLNGDLPRAKVVRNYVNKDTFVLGADGGSNGISKYKILPNAVIGDMDSIRPAKLAEFKRKNIEIIKIDEQETTDFEKCLMYCLNKNFKKIYIFGGSGPRADHTLNNYSIMKRYYKKLDLTMIDQIFEISFISNNIKFNYKKDALVSLLAMPRATNVKTRGLLFPLDYETLEFGTREGTLNVSRSTTVAISFEKGSLLLFKKHFL